jgi:aldehyde dehydrogenase (NAD+)
VTLELGGQSPVVIDKTANLKLAAKRVLFGKLQNAGQLCVSPNHVLILREAQEEFIEAAKAVYKELWPNGSLEHKDTFARIVSPPHFKRISAYLDQSKGQVAFGGKKEGERGLEMTVVKDVAFDDSLLTE